jgi:hypothetical protein
MRGRNAIESTSDPTESLPTDVIANATGLAPTASTINERRPPPRRLFLASSIVARDLGGSRHHGRQRRRLRSRALRRPSLASHDRPDRGHQAHLVERFVDMGFKSRDLGL